MRAGSGGGAGGGGRGKGGKSSTGTVAAVAGTLGASAAPAASAPAAAAAPAAAPAAQAAKAVSAAPIKVGEFDARDAPGLAERSAAIAAHTGNADDRLMAAIDKVANRNGDGLLLVEDVRKEAGMSKEAFDRAAISLSSNERAVLHYHDIPQSLTPAKRAQMVVDSEGTHYIGIARRLSTLTGD